MNKSRLVVLGVNSGTSIDGIDMAAIEIKRVKNSYAVTYLSGKEKKYSRKLQHSLQLLANSATPNLHDAINIDNLLGDYIGNAAHKFIETLAQQKIIVDIIASHGQTICHLPKEAKSPNNYSATFQIGSADLIAAQTMLPVIADFRQADIAIGNEGAPITSGAMGKLFNDKKESRLIVNIGGMSNYFYIPKNAKPSEVIAKDCGPGNILSDLLTQILFNKKYDKNGLIAAKGNLSEQLLKKMMTDQFYISKTKSTGRETFGLKKVHQMIAYQKKCNLSSEDLLTTAIECTAHSIVRAINPIVKKDRKVEKLYLTGGGRKNIFLVKRLKQLLPSLSVLNIDILGINGDFVEAVSYAVLGEAFFREERIHNLSGRNGFIPLPGKLSLPPAKR